MKLKSQILFYFKYNFLYSPLVQIQFEKSQPAERQQHCKNNICCYQIVELLLTTAKSNYYYYSSLLLTTKLLQHSSSSSLVVYRAEDRHRHQLHASDAWSLATRTRRRNSMMQSKCTSLALRDRPQCSSHWRRCWPRRTWA